MKLLPLSVLTLATVAFLGSAAPYAAAAKPKKAEAPNIPAALSKKLAPYIEHLDPLLALKRPAGGAGGFCNGAEGKLVILKQGFLTERPTAAPADQAAIDAAIATCDRISAALDERQKMVVEIQSSKSTKSSGTLGQTRKETLGQGIHGGDWAKAVGTVEEAKREQRDAADAKKRAAQDESFLNSAVVNGWNQRTVALRQQITASYQQIALPPAPAQAQPAAGQLPPAVLSQ